MSTLLDDDQARLAEQLRAVFAQHATAESLREIAEKPGAWNAALWKQLCELGMQAVHIPEAYGGAELGALDLGVIATEVGRSLAPVPFTSSICLAAEALVVAGTETQKKRWLPRIASGEVVGTLAWTEGATAPIVGRIDTRFESGRLSGCKLPVPDGGAADLCIVVASENGRPCITLVELDQPEVTRAVLASIDQLRPQYQIEFSGAVAEPMNGLEANEALSQILDRAAMYRAFEQVGGAEAAMLMTRDHTLSRRIFGRQLASFQAVKHKLADVYAAWDLAQCNALAAAQALDGGQPEFAAAAATARIGATSAYELAARECIQLHGGVGFTTEYDCHLHYRRARLLALDIGSIEFWSDRLISRVELTPEVEPDRATARLRQELPVQEESREDAAYRARARQWIAANSFDIPGRASVENDKVAEIDRAKAWTKRKHEAGYSAIDTPAEFGGAGGTPAQARIFAEEESRADLSVELGRGYIQAMTAIRYHATLEQRRKWESLTHSGEATWCQLFSEPGAGSDLAGLRTRATRDGDTWTFDGQKVWTSGGDVADYGILIARSDPSVPKHQGISFFIIDMRQPGVTTRPIRQINGESEFTETFFNSAVAPDENRLGEEGAGWAVAMTVLGHERNTVGNTGVRGRRSPTSSLSLIELARRSQRDEGTAADSASVRGRIAQFHVQAQGIKNFTRRLRQQLAETGKLPPGMPVMKLTTTNRMQQIHAFILELQEAAGVVQISDEEHDKFFEYLTAAGMRIAGGADEVLRNQIAERALGMPGEIRTDRDVPFESLPY